MINQINQLSVGTSFTPSSGAISANDNAKVALQKLQGEKTNLISSPTANNFVYTDVNGQPIDSGIAFSTSAALGLSDTLSPSEKAVKTYVDSVAIAGIKWKDAIHAASTAPLADAYTATAITLTANANGAFPAQDGVTSVVNNLYLVKDESGVAAPSNGFYELSVVGDAATAWVLTRTQNADTWGELVGATSLVLNGAVNKGDTYTSTIAAGGTLGTTAVTLAKAGEGTAYTAGTGLSLAANIFSITNTAVLAGSVSNVSKVPALTVNAQGQLTAMSEAPIAIASSQVISGQLVNARMPSKLQGGSALTPGISFAPSSAGQIFNGNVTIDVSLMTLDKFYSFNAAGADVIITFTNGTLTGFTAQGSSTTQIISDGSIMNFRKVSPTVVFLA